MEGCLQSFIHTYKNTDIHTLIALSEQVFLAAIMKKKKKANSEEYRIKWVKSNCFKNHGQNVRKKSATIFPNVKLKTFQILFLFQKSAKKFVKSLKRFWENSGL